MAYKFPTEYPIEPPSYFGRHDQYSNKALHFARKAVKDAGYKPKSGYLHVATAMLDAGIVVVDLKGKRVGKARGRTIVKDWYAHWFLPEKVRRPKKRPKKRAKKLSNKKQTTEFLKSWEWRTLRYKIIMKFGRKCMCCGATPDDGVTVICVDHIKPRHTHPELSLDEDNLQVLCGVCNQGKGAWDSTDFRSAGEPNG